MNRLRLFLLALSTTSFAVGITAFRTVVSASPHVGLLSPAALEPGSGHSATLLPDGKVLIAGGMRGNQDFYRSTELYDPATGTFQPSGEMSMARVGHVALLLDRGKC